MRRFADQDPSSATEPSCQLPLLRKSSRSVKQKIGFQPLGKNGGKLIEKYGSAESRALFTAFKRSTPNNLGRSLAKGQHRKGTFRSEQFKGCCIVGATQGNLGCQATLAVTVLPDWNPPAAACWGCRAISRNDQCFSWSGRGW